MKKIVWSVSVGTTVLLGAGYCRGGATVQIADDAKIDFGYTIQAQVVGAEKYDSADNAFESDLDAKVRRARLRASADVTSWMSAMLQTDAAPGEKGRAGMDWRLIDAWVALKPHELFNIYVGENLAPANRQNLTSAGSLMALDWPGVTYKTLTWGARSMYAFSTETFSDSDSGLRGESDVRDTGVTLFGSRSLGTNVHFKYYLGGYDGIQATGGDEPRFTARVQLNFLAPEKDYYCQSAYLGKKKTVGVGASFDKQDNVTNIGTVAEVNYTFYTVDAFADLPVGKGQLTVEAAYENLDFEAESDSGTVTALPSGLAQSAGDGFYVQAGYLIGGKWQPWAEYEHWDSKSADRKGDFDTYRVGLTYYFKGHNANVKVGYEQLRSDTGIRGTTDDTLNTVVTAFSSTY